MQLGKIHPFNPEHLPARCFGNRPYTGSDAALEARPRTRTLMGILYIALFMDRVEIANACALEIGYNIALVSAPDKFPPLCRLPVATLGTSL